MSRSVKAAFGLGALLCLALPAMAQQDTAAQNSQNPGAQDQPNRAMRNRQNRSMRDRQDGAMRDGQNGRMRDRDNRGMRDPQGSMMMGGPNPAAEFVANVQRAQETLNQMQALFTRMDERKRQQSQALGAATAPAPGEAATAPGAAPPDAAR